MTTSSTSVKEAAKRLGQGVTPDNVHARIRRGSLSGFRTESGEWRVDAADLERATQEIELCASCQDPANSYVIVKYHNHVRVEFSLCHAHAFEAEKAYSRQGGVLEVRTFPIRGEGWLK